MVLAAFRQAEFIYFCCQTSLVFHRHVSPSFPLSFCSSMTTVLYSDLFSIFNFQLINLSSINIFLQNFFLNDIGVDLDTIRGTCIMEGGGTMKREFSKQSIQMLGVDLTYSSHAPSPFSPSLSPSWFSFATVRLESCSIHTITKYMIIKPYQISIKTIF